MDNLGILGFLNNLSKFYQDNKSDFDSVTDEQEKVTNPQQSSEKAQPSQNKKSDNNYPTVYFSEKFLETIKSHDEFVKRVLENNKNATPPQRKKRGRKPKPKVSENEQTTSNSTT